MEKLLVILATICSIGLLWLIFYVPIFGLHYETARGEHTGYITAVERTGLFYKTGTAYLKTDTQSSQEDAYCFIDGAIEKQLQEYSINKVHINAYFFSWFGSGIANCAGEGQIIYKVEPLGK